MERKTELESEYQTSFSANQTAERAETMKKEDKLFYSLKLGKVRGWSGIHNQPRLHEIT